MSSTAFPSDAAHEAAVETLLPEDRAEAAIAACDGDLRAACRALAVALDEVETELLLTRAAVSRGFSRGWHHRS